MPAAGLTFMMAAAISLSRTQRATTHSKTALLRSFPKTMNTQQKIDAIIAAIREHETIFKAVEAPTTPGTYNLELTEGMRKGLIERISAIVANKV